MIELLHVALAVSIKVRCSRMWNIHHLRACSSTRKALDSLGGKERLTTGVDVMPIDSSPRMSNVALLQGLPVTFLPQLKMLNLLQVSLPRYFWEYAG